jgi:hypothetical protein
MDGGAFFSQGSRDEERKNLVFEPGVRRRFRLPGVSAATAATPPVMAHLAFREDETCPDVSEPDVDSSP